ncbi:hypothetical protein C0992_000344 [Termitomyces sp. T32_za158]|nr:hypothetical protein C0992_000344 [Termitomyces sp. T32_za158]
MNDLLQFVSSDDGVVQSWVFLCFAAVAAADSSSGVEEATWDIIWTNAIRRANVPTVSRAACHAAYTILLHTRVYTQKPHLLQIPLASNRILSEIETLAKELDVQGPPYPFDSVCAFLATCLRVANKDMHLYRMQLEEKVLSWLIDCWQTAGFRDKSLPLHLGKDLLMLFESISGFPMPVSLPCRIPLPEGQVVEVLVNEARTTVIKDYILDARLPELKSATERDGLVTLPPAPPSDDNSNSLVQPRGRERRISAFLIKTLERMQFQLDDQSMNPTAESARRSLDMAVTAVCYDSVLVLNGMQSDKRLSRCACKLIGTIIALLPDRRWTTSERALIAFGLDPLTFLGDSSEEKSAWTAMLPPDIGSGIKSRLLNQLSWENTDENAFWNCSNLLKTLWQNKPYLHGPITREHLSSVLGDHRISSSKFRLVRRLREHGINGEFDRDNFTKVDFWRLKECIPPSNQLQDADLDAFATLLYLSKGQLGGFRNEPSGSTSILGRYRRKVSRMEKGTQISPQEPIILMLLAMLQGEHPSRSNTAYETLRLIMSAERNNLPRALRLSLSENQVELEYLGRYERLQLSQVSRDLTDLVTQQSYLDSVINFPRWVAGVTTLLSEVLSSKDAFYAQLIPILRLDAEFAEQVLPILVHNILATENEELVNQETIVQAHYRDTISNFFTSVLSDKSSSIQCLRCVIDVMLHLRHFDREQTSNIGAKVIKDALSYNKWLNVDFALLAHSSITCGAYTTALLFLELAAEGHAVSQDTSNEILYEIYRHIDEPDGFYAIHDSDLHQSLIKRFHHEKQWERAFRFHGAALEAGTTIGDTEGLVQSFHSFGFDHLANDVLRTAFSSGGAKKDGLSNDISYRLAWRTETWDLPESSEKTLGLEDFAEIRDVIQDVMCLHEVAKWRTNTIPTSLATRDLTKGDWSEFLKVEDDFDFSTLENILATRISLVRSVRLKEERQRIGTLVTPFNQNLIDIETQCLVRLSKAARAANEVQLALNSILRAVGLEKPPAFDVFEEFANVLWCHKEEKTAVEYLGKLFAAGQGAFVRDAVEDRRKALVYAQLGSWSSAACLKNLEDIQTDYFSAAAALLESDNLKNLSGNSEAHNVHATVYYQYAIFAERQYYDIMKSPDAMRWKIYVDRKQREIESLDEQIRRPDVEEKVRKLLIERRAKAQKVKDADADSFQRHNCTLDGFLNQAIEMYSRCLGISDAYDQDVPIRLCSLWFAHFEETRGNFQTAVGNALQRVPSRKFVFLSVTTTTFTVNKC